MADTDATVAALLARLATVLAENARLHHRVAELESKCLQCKLEIHALHAGKS